MLWKVPVNKATLPNYPVRIGYLAFPDGQRKYEEYPYSFLSVMVSGNLDKVNGIERISDIAESSVKSGGSTQPGVFYYSLSNNDERTFQHPGLQCFEWIKADEGQDAISVPINVTYATLCPSTRDQVSDSSYQLYSTIDGINCYIHRVPLYSNLPEMHTPRCCYLSSGAIITSPRLAKNLYARYTGTKLQADDDMYSLCCGQAYLETGYTSTELCSRYLERRPVSTDTNYKSITICMYYFYSYH